MVCKYDPFYNSENRQSGIGSEEAEQAISRIRLSIEELRTELEGTIENQSLTLSQGAAAQADNVRQELSQAVSSLNDDIDALSARITSEAASLSASISSVSVSSENSISQQADTINGRIDNIIASNNPTEGNSELEDIRTGTDGRVYQSAGTAVRDQLTALDSRINSIGGQFRILNILDPSQVNEGKYLRFTVGNLLAVSGNTISDVSNLILSPIIPVSPGDVVHIRMIHSSYAGIAVANAGKTILSVTATAEGISDYTVTIPAAGRYIQFCSRRTYYDTNWRSFCMVSVNTELTENFTEYNTSELIKNKDISDIRADTASMRSDIDCPNTAWRNKKCAVLGSSLTANGGWTDVIKERFGFSKLYNRGIGGTTLANFSGCGFGDYSGSFRVFSDSSSWDEERSTVFAGENADSNTYTVFSGSWYSSENRINLLPADTDLVIIDLAVNDYFRVYNHSLDWNGIFNIPQINTKYRQGINPPEYDDRKFGDAFALMVKRIRTRCPDAVIAVWGMLYNSAVCNYNAAAGEVSDSLDKYYDLNEYIKKLCSYFGIPFIDMLSQTGINVFSLTEYCEDGVHPYKENYSTEKGKYAVADAITAQLRNISPKHQ